jgi:D-cysteine desulfhydrase
MISSSTDNTLYIKRDDLYPLSFGGNKARKGRLFFEDIQRVGADHVVTYGSNSSNHCRVIANLAAMYGMPCTIISPEETIKDTANKKMISLMGAAYRYCPVSRVAATIQQVMEELRSDGACPYFIQGGGHGNIGTKAYVDAYQEIWDYEQTHNIHFDYIFFASGTGTTHAGLVCGQYLHQERDQQIVGISIARTNPRGKQVVIDSIRDYLGEDYVEPRAVHFIDRYVGGGYGLAQSEVTQLIRRELRINGIPLDTTYTGKAFYGMEQFILENGIKDKNILFIHTGGTPLFFDDLEYMQ